MNTPHILHGLSQAAEDYDILLCDVWGVIHNGRKSFPRACEALERFQRERGPVILISNSPRPSEAVRPQLTELGVPDGAWTSFITSGDATRALLAERAPGPAWRIGPDRDHVLYDGLGLDFSGPAEAAFVACTGPVDDDVETPEDYRQDLSVAAGRGLTMICANPDRVVHRGEKLIYCGGALADLYAALGGAVVMAGKPYPAIYDLCLAEAERLLGRHGRPLCVGDGVLTDVKGAFDHRLDCLFIAAGVHGAQMQGAGGDDLAARAGKLLSDHGLDAAFAMPTLNW